MKKIGILTYHAAYNYGSVFQAYATQEAINNLGYYSEIIDYRMSSQSEIYRLYRIHYGVSTLIKDLIQFPIHKKRNLRIIAFEDFIHKYMSLTKECKDAANVQSLWNNYEVIVSGSDQIWNKHSLELEYSDWDCMNIFLLEGYLGRKISYASSIGNMTDEELKKIINAISDFYAVSMREEMSAKRIENTIHRNVITVLDPTFLLSKDEWIRKLQINYKKEEFILYYSLGGYHTIKEILPILNSLAKKLKCRIKVITPFYNTPKSTWIYPMPECGPCKFLEAIYNAKMVITDSYHGTILSVNFGKDVYSLCKEGGSEFRKTDILKRLGIAGRIITDYKKILSDFQPIDYELVYKKLDCYRQESLGYLKNALSGK